MRLNHVFRGLKGMLQSFLTLLVLLHISEVNWQQVWMILKHYVQIVSSERSHDIADQKEAFNC